MLLRVLSNVFQTKVFDLRYKELKCSNELLLNQYETGLPNSLMK